MGKTDSPEVFSHEVAYKESLEYFGGDVLAADVWLNKYALRDNDGNLLEKTPDQMHRRLAREFARIESKKFKKPLTEDEIFGHFDHFRYIICQGSPMFGIGNDYQTISLSNCYLAGPGPEDSYADILRIDEQLVQISKRRGGVGIDISKLRPAGAATHNAAKTSTGILSFMERYSNSIREVGQSGRRGALMITLSVHHPQVLDFINAKKDRMKITGANISVRLSNEFLDAVEKDTEYELRWPVDSTKPKLSKMVRAKDVWDQIIKNAHDAAEPGVLFWDNIMENTPADCYEEWASRGTNPCSELNLSYLDSCRLLLLNLYSYVVNPFTDKAYFDYELFTKHVYVAQRLMDDLVDLEAEKIQKILDKIKSDPESNYIKQREKDMWEQILKNCVNGRRTGTGITGLGDALAAKNLEYGSPNAILTTEKIYRTLKLAAYRSSVDMAKELGAFKTYDADKESRHPFIARIRDEDKELYDDMRKYGRRNVALLTTAPAGSVSLLTQTTSGIEPLFEMYYTRRKKINPNEKNARVDFVDQSGDAWQHFKIFHNKITTWMGITTETDVEKSPWAKCCAEDIPWESRVRMQAAAQKHVCHSISSTINLLEDVSVKEVGEIYKTAWKMGLKGITVYRKNSRTGVLVEQKDETVPVHIVKTIAVERPKILPCDIHHIKVSKKLDKVRTFDFLVLVGLLSGSPYECFAFENGQVDKKITKGILVKVGKGHYQLMADDKVIVDNVTKDTTEYEDALTRMTSTALRHGAEVEFVVQQLEKSVGAHIGSFAKAMARALKIYIVDGTNTGDACPDCGQELIRQSGCVQCSNCPWTKCG